MQGRRSAADDTSNAEWIGRRTISLPLSAQLGEEDVADVIAAVTRVLREATKH